MKPFQIVLLLIAGFVGVIAVLVFGGFLPSPGTSGENAFGGEVVLWGPFPADQMQTFMADMNQDNGDFFRISYVAKNPDTFRKDLVSALASGKGPDMVLFPHDILLPELDKFYPLSYESLTELDFRSTFVDGADIFLSAEGSYAVPLVVDPLVMYYNKEILSSASVALPPRTWEELSTLAETLTVRNDNGSITESAVALGGLKNVLHVKEILSTLFMQAGETLVSYDAGRGTHTATLGRDGAKGASSGLRFYVDFGNPAKKNYSWNSAMPTSRQAFEGGTVAFYFGLASEYDAIAERNPHLDFGVAQVPELSAGKSRSVFGHYYALGILKSSKNLNTAYRSIFAFLAEGYPAKLSMALRLPSTAREVLSKSIGDAVLDLFARSAISARGWRDPNPEESTSLFAEMVESVIIGSKTDTQAVQDANTRLDNEITE